MWSTDLAAKALELFIQDIVETAVEQTRNGRYGIYDIRVTNRAGETVALFRGKSAQIKGTVIPEDR